MAMDGRWRRPSSFNPPRRPPGVLKELQREITERFRHRPSRRSALRPELGHRRFEPAPDGRGRCPPPRRRGSASHPRPLPRESAAHARGHARRSAGSAATTRRASRAGSRDGTPPRRAIRCARGRSHASPPSSSACSHSASAVSSVASVASTRPRALRRHQSGAGAPSDGRAHRPPRPRRHRRAAAAPKRTAGARGRALLASATVATAASMARRDRPRETRAVAEACLAAASPESTSASALRARPRVDARRCSRRTTARLDPALLVGTARAHRRARAHRSAPGASHVPHGSRAGCARAPRRGVSMTRPEEPRPRVSTSTTAAVGAAAPSSAPAPPSSTVRVKS